MTKLINLIKFFAVLLPVVFELIKQFETPGFGPEKKKAVLDAISLFYDEFSKLAIIPITKEKVLDIVGKLIDLIVLVFNLIGIFKKSENPS